MTAYYQIKEFRENHGVVYSIRENEIKKILRLEVSHWLISDR